MGKAETRICNVFSILTWQRGKARTCGFGTLDCRAPRAKAHVRVGVVWERRAMWSKLQLTPTHEIVVFGGQLGCHSLKNMGMSYFLPN